MPQRWSSASVMLYCLLSKTMTCPPPACCTRSATASLAFLLLKVLMQPLHAFTDAWCDECRLPHCWRQPGTPHGTQR